MRAVVITRFGAPDVFSSAEIPVPDPGPGQVLIRVAASSVNPLDYKLRAGLLPELAPAFPAVLHGDVAGRVAALGPGVKGFAVGDQVYACAGGITGQGGALAEFMVADADLVAHAPRSLSLAQAAVLPLVAITAWEAVVDRANVLPGQRVLVHGGAGGVGHVAIQLAKLRGAFVYTTVSSDAKAAVARELGADGTINYRCTPVADYAAKWSDGDGFDVVIDTVGGEALAASFAAVKTSGTVVTIAARSQQDLTLLHNKGVTLHVVLMLLPMLTGKNRAHHGEILRSVAGLADAGRLRPLIHSETFMFTEAGRAHSVLESGSALGKVSLVSPWFC